MDFALGTVFDFKFTTKAYATGVPTTLSGSPVIQIYEDNNTTQITTGITLTVDFDSVTGLNNVRVDTASGNGFEVGKCYSMVITTGTVNGVSVVGEVLCNFGIQKEYTGTVSASSSAISKVASSATITTGSETNTYTNTTQLDGSLHIVEDAGGTTDFYYEFTLGGSSVPVEVILDFYAQANGDTWKVYAYNWTLTSWEQIGSINGLNGTTIRNLTFNTTDSHVGSSANLGKVRVRIYSTDGVAIGVDRILCAYTVLSQSAGYANGAIYVDTNASNTNTENYIDGVADNPVSTWAAALTLSSQLGIKTFHIAGGSSITLTADSSNYELNGAAYNLDLNGQIINNMNVIGARVTGTGIVSGTAPVFEYCGMGTVILGPSRLYQCGIGRSSGTFTGGSAGQFVLIDCFSLVPGSGSPSFDFSGLGSTVGINNRGWKGGSSYTLDSDCTISHEVIAGGTTSFVAGGANIEVRGICAALNFTVSASENIRFVGVTGNITVTDNSSVNPMINLFGVSATLTDSESIANDYTVSNDNINIEVDSAISDATLATLANQTTILSNQTNIETDTQDIQSRLPSALSSNGNMKSDIQEINNTDITGDGSTTPWGPS